VQTFIEAFLLFAVLGEFECDLLSKASRSLELYI